MVPYGHGAQRRWRHLNIFEYRCEIVCALPRGRCMSSGKVSTVRAPWEGLSKSFTVAFESFCLFLAKEMPMAQVSACVGEHHTKLWRTLKRHVVKARPNKSMADLRVLGCDEMSIRKGHNYATVFADLEKREVIFATEGKDQKTWKVFGEDLAKHGGDLKRIEYASMDMSGAYKAAAKEYAPQAIKVFDKFHVIKLANDALDQVRRTECRNHPFYRHQMKNTRYHWLKNPQKLDEQQQQKLDAIAKMNLSTSKAYQMKLNLQDVYRMEDHLRAHRGMRAWIRWVRQIAAKDVYLKPMQRLAATIAEHLDGILAHWQDKVTNAFMEGLMSVFSATKRKARGYRTFANLRAMLYFTASNLDIPCAAYFNAK
ncbi:MAG: ISL3 family transposase [Verrucomicrobia bacterium]|nr:ISL3 family transposase [Verrucomicrobiota bacterium]